MTKAAVYAVSPGLNLIPGMDQTPEVAANRYIQASEFGSDVSGRFFASAKGKFSGPMELQREPHLRVRASQEAAWHAVVKVSGADLFPPAVFERGVLTPAAVASPRYQPELSKNYGRNGLPGECEWHAIKERRW